jgi:epimerase transport system membrane fusion protein
MNSIQQSIISGNDQSIKRFGFSTVFIVFGVIGIWSVLVPLNSGSYVQGSVIVDSYRKTIQHVQGGMIKSILVKDGDHVEKGQLLMSLDAAQSESELNNLSGQYYIVLSKNARLQAQRDGLKEIRYSDELLMSGDQKAIDAMETQNQMFRSKQSSLDNEYNVYNKQIDQLRVKQSGLRTQLGSLNNIISSYNTEKTDFEPLVKRGFIEKQRMRDLDRTINQSRGRQGDLQSQIAEIEISIAEIQLKIIQLQKEFQKEVSLEQTEVQSQLFELSQKVKAVKTDVDRSNIVSPYSGVVLGLSVHTIGGVVPAGNRIMDIVPQDEKLVVEAQIPVNDINHVKIGQTVEVKFNSFKDRKLPKIEGSLISVSADRITDHNKESNPYYLARIEINKNGLDSLSERSLELIPGMSVDCIINTGSRTFFSYIAQPLTDSFSKSFLEK